MIEIMKLVLQAVTYPNDEVKTKLIEHVDTFVVPHTDYRNKSILLESQDVMRIKYYPLCEKKDGRC